MYRGTMDSGANYANGAPGSLEEMRLWSSGLRRAMSLTNFWSPFMKSKRTGGPIVYEQRPGSVGGAVVTLRTEGALGGLGKRGDNLFTSAAQMGDIPYGSFNVRLDLMSQATGITPWSQEAAGLMGLIEGGLNDHLGKWGGRRVGMHIDHTLAHKCAATSRMWANNKADVNALRSADTASVSIIRNGKLTMSEQGGVGYDSMEDGNGVKIPHYGWFLPERIADSIKRDAEYREANQLNADRGMKNLWFTGDGIAPIDGNKIIERRQIIEQGQIPSGSPFAPIAHVGVVSNAGGATLYGGGQFYKAGVLTDWFVHFPGALFQFGEFETTNLATSFWGTGTRYALIRNPSTGTDAGKLGMIEYTVDAGNHSLTIVKRLATAISGINNTTVGNVNIVGTTINAANVTNAYQKGASIIPCNSYGVPIGIMCGLGRDALGFVKGNLWGEIFEQMVQGGMNGKQRFTGWTFGAEPYRLPDNLTTPGIIMVGCAVAYPDMGLPVVV